jgi:CubicO group peptidase (beta-lactamase class C family)
MFQPLGMNDTFFNVPAAKQARVVAVQQHQQDGSFVEPPPPPFVSVKFFSGGGGLFSTAGDYLKFARMLLNGGKLGNKRILRAETVDQMFHNQIGELTLVQLRSMIPQFAQDPIRLPGSPDKFGLGFGINSKPVEGGRSTGSAAWAGIYNTFFWIDSARKTCAVIFMQTLPFSDDTALSVVESFERAVYAQPAVAAARTKR